MALVRTAYTCSFRLPTYSSFTFSLSRPTPNSRTPLSFLLFFLLLGPLPALSLRLSIPLTAASVNTPTPVEWIPEPTDGMGQDSSLPPLSDETSLFDIRFVDADTMTDDGLAKANVDVRLALASGGRRTDNVVFQKPGCVLLPSIHPSLPWFLV